MAGNDIVNIFTYLNFKIGFKFHGKKLKIPEISIRNVKEDSLLINGKHSREWTSVSDSRLP